jgi:hypothetical protein
MVIGIEDFRVLAFAAHVAKKRRPWSKHRSMSHPPLNWSVQQSTRNKFMGTKSTIRFQQKEGEMPGWTVYTELFAKEDVVYLEVEGVQADVTMIGTLWGAPAGTVLLRLPATTARQIGLVPPDWKKNTSGMEE